MTNDQQSVERLFEAALGLPPEQRRGFLDRACSDAPVLHHLVEQLIEAEGIPVSFLQSPVFQGQNGQSSAPTLSLTGLDGPPRFGVEHLIAGRFQVVRFIARGGMGEVYEVRDRFLQGTPLALKIIRPHIATDPYTSHRFEQEVMLARRVNHRNLCPIYDIFHCEQPAPPFLFLTMKLLAGESLESRLKRHEEIPVDQGVQICRQLIEGIEAIHSVGIIHRDIKPNNVMLERSGSEICVTIMDFGLARLTETDATLFRSGLIAGTPGYLAPELIRGASPSPASDLYALGVVLHQVLTGLRPSPSRNGHAAVVSPKLNTSGVPPALIQAVTEFLSEDPERRCLAFEQIVREAGVRAQPPAPRLLTRRNFAVGGAAALACLGAGSIWKRHEIDDYFHPLPAKRFVALLNWPPPADTKVTPILLGLIDTMVSALSRAEAFDRNFYVACQNTLTEMKTPAQVNDVCESLGTNLILATSGSIVQDGILVSLQVLSAATSKVLRARTLHVLTAQQFALPELATRAAAQLLNVSSLPVSGSVNQTGTDNPNALAAYQAAEALMKEPDNTGLSAAIEKFKLAVELDQRFAEAHARLSVAYYKRFFEHRDPTLLMLAGANAETALNLDPDCAEAHSALSTVYEERGDFPQALREMARALAIDPSDSRIAIYQAQLYFDLNRWHEAEESFKRVLKSRPNYWLAYHELGNNYSYQGKYRLALQAFQAASMNAPRNALAVANIAWMHFFLGHLDQAETYVAKSLAMTKLPWTLQVRADILRARNKFTESLQAALQTTEINPEDDGGWLRVADAYARIGHHEKQALDGYKNALAAAGESLKINSNDGATWMRMALYQSKVGDSASAKASLREAEAKNAIDIYSLIYKARILKLSGRQSDALATLVTCIKMGATPTQIKSTNDLQDLTSNPRYSSLLAPSMLDPV